MQHRHTKNQIQIGSLVLDGTPRIAVGFADETPVRVIEEAPQHGLDIAELRIDQFSSYEEEHVTRIIKRFRNLPTIATIRTKQEGGAWDRSEVERRDLLEAIIPLVDAIDIELRSEEIRNDVVTCALSSNKTVQISYHDFETTPSLEELGDLCDAAKSLGGNLIKVATQINSNSDLRRLAEFTLSHADKGLVTIGMGANGLTSRVFFPALGSLMTFAYIGKPTAEGQLNLQTTFELLRQFYPKYNEEKVNILQLVENF